MASEESLAIARAWTFSDVSKALTAWVNRSPDQEAATIHQATSLG
jgi:hypothetical protein